MVIRVFCLWTPQIQLLKALGITWRVSLMKESAKHCSAMASDLKLSETHWWAKSPQFGSVCQQKWVSLHERTIWADFLFALIEYEGYFLSDFLSGFGYFLRMYKLDPFSKMEKDQVFYNLLLYNLGESVRMIALDSCSWLTRVNPDVVICCCIPSHSVFCFWHHSV